MSQENVKKFFTEIEKNELLKQKCIDAMKECSVKSEEILEKTLVKLGGEMGFSFNVEDLRQARNELIDKLNENKELGDSDLLAFAGGSSATRILKGFGFILGSIASFGIACAVISAVEDSKGKGKCAENVSLTCHPAP